jgi:regulator of replication initiation timing
MFLNSSVLADLNSSVLADLNTVRTVRAARTKNKPAVNFSDCQDNFDLSQPLSNLTNDCTVSIQENTDLTAENTNLSQPLSNLTNDCTVSIQENTDLKDLYTDLTAENDRLKQDNSDLTAQNDRLKQDNSDLTAQNDRLNQDNSDLTAENIDLSQELNSWKDEYAKLFKEHSCLKTEKQSQNGVNGGGSSRESASMNTISLKNPPMITSHLQNQENPSTKSQSRVIIVTFILFFVMYIIGNMPSKSI